MKRVILLIVVSMLSIHFLYAGQTDAVNISTTSYMQKWVKNKKGKRIKKWVKSTKVVPGDIIKYVDTISNDSNITIKNINVLNPINKNLSFLGGSLRVGLKNKKSKGIQKVNYEVRYSVDGAKSYDLASNLYVKDKKGKRKKAKAKDYNGIEIKIDEILPKSKIVVEFKVKLK